MTCSNTRVMETVGGGRRMLSLVPKTRSMKERATRAKAGYLVCAVGRTLERTGALDGIDEVDWDDGEDDRDDGGDASSVMRFLNVCSSPL